MQPACESTILVVDDTEANRYGIVRHLRRAGYRVWEAATGREAIGLADQMPDLIILDIKLPDILGYEVCRAVKENPKTENIPVLHISATFQLSSDRVRGLEGGADAFLTGPVEPEELVANVKVLLRLRETTESLRHTNQRLAKVLSSITDAYFAVSPTWHLLETNPVADEKVFGGSGSELVGQEIWQTIPENGAATLRQYGQNAVTTGQTVHFEMPLGQRWFEMHVYPSSDRLEVYARDITERKQAEEAVRQARDDLASANADLEKAVLERTNELCELVGELEYFSYTIAHDMRAPLRAMQGFGDLLMEECGECSHSERLDLIRRISTAAGRMDRLITDALDYTKALRQEISLTPVDTAALLRGMVDGYPQFQLPCAKVEIAAEMPAVMGNEAALTQCFSNLLNNAVKFVQPGTMPEVKVWAEPQEPWVRICVQDNGTGIAKESQGRIFGLFERLDPAREGTGIGLALVQKVVRRMGGRVGVESEPGRGSRFWVELRMVPS